MKTLLLASAMALGMTTVAYAQDMQTTDDEGQTTQPDMQPPPETPMPPEEPMPETTPPESPDTMAPPPDTTAPPPAVPDTTPPTTTPGATTPDTTMPPSGEMPPTGEPPAPPPEGTMPPETTPPAGTMPETTAPGGAAAGGMDLDAHFDQFDEDKNGQLSPLEFATMVAAMRGTASSDVAAAEKDRTSKKSDNKATDLINQSAGELSKADTNHDFMVSREESAAWHQSGATGV